MQPQGGSERSNRLAKQSSPYLLQHAKNPVDWYPWGDEAFEKARREDKPVFLSIGYSTCHWCHVMERESFENEHIAEIMNEHFVSVKVDREQRPDVDAVYMRLVQMMTGAGGWPLSAFLTPDGKPFYGGTYFPPADMYGRPGFERILLTIAQLWKDKRSQLAISASRIAEAVAAEGRGRGEIDPRWLNHAFELYKRSFDGVYGGFASAPKFPQPSGLTFLLRYWHRTGQEDALLMAEKTLKAMAEGGIHDQLGGGFHRYSTDAQWLVPHFEKMLYDQALLSRVYMEAYQATGKRMYAEVAADIFEYVLRDMTDEGGGFYSAEDADSEGREGAFYVWDAGEVDDVLGVDAAGVFRACYGVSGQGNFEGTNILSVSESVDSLAVEFDKTPEQIEDLLSEAREKLFAERSGRIRPDRDDKVIAGWNGLMIGAMAFGGAATGQRRYLRAAERAAERVLERLMIDGRLRRFYRGDRVEGLAFLEDYAYLARGFLELYEAVFEVGWLQEAKRLANAMMDLFADEKGGGFYSTGSDSERLIARDKPAYDGAAPSGNSVAADVLLRLGALTADQRYTDAGSGIIEGFSSEIAGAPANFSEMLCAVSFATGPRQEIVVAGKTADSGAKAMLRTVQGRYLPEAVVVFHQEGPAGESIAQEAPFVREQTAVSGRSAAYICENYTCSKPVTEVSKLEETLDKRGR